MKAALCVVGLGALAAVAWWSGLLERTGLPQPDRPTSAATQVYRWTDAQGRRHYGDAPPAGVRAELSDLPRLTVVSMPKPTPEKPTPSAAKIDSTDAASDHEETAPPMPSRQLRNPALERMGLTEAPTTP